MRVLPAFSALVTLSLLAAPSSGAAALVAVGVGIDDAAPVTRALASSSDEATAAEELRATYLGGGDLTEMTESEVKAKLDELNAEAKTDPELEALLETLGLDTPSMTDKAKDWVAKVGNSIGSALFGKDDNSDGVFGTVWKRLFGGKKEETAAVSGTGGSGSSSDSGSTMEDVGNSNSNSSSSSSPADTSIEEPTTSSASKDDTSIETMAPAPTPTKTTATSSSVKLLTSLPLAGVAAAMVVINFVQ